MNISLIEFAVYAFVTYFSLAMLIITTIRSPNDKTRRLALVKAGYMFPGIICAIILAGSGVEILLDSGTTVITNVYNGSSGLLLNNSTTVSTPNKIVLQNPVWVPFHYMLAAVMISFVFIQVLTMLTAKD